jgi:hypothetical protein
MPRSTISTIPPTSLPAIAATLRNVRSNDPGVSFAIAESLQAIDEVLGVTDLHAPGSRALLKRMSAGLYHLESLGVLKLGA